MAGCRCPPLAGSVNPAGSGFHNPRSKKEFVMKWKIKKPNYKVGDLRDRKMFAWRKTKVGDYYVWLETYCVRERYFQPISGTPGWWSEIEKIPLFWCD
jgi:hypothetical protein